MSFASGSAATNEGVLATDAAKATEYERSGFPLPIVWQPIGLRSGREVRRFHCAREGAPGALERVEDERSSGSSTRASAFCRDSRGKDRKDWPPCHT